MSFNHAIAFMGTHEELSGTEHDHNIIELMRVLLQGCDSEHTHDILTCPGFNRDQIVEADGHTYGDLRRGPFTQYTSGLLRDNSPNNNGDGVVWADDAPDGIEYDPFN